MMKLLYLLFATVILFTSCDKEDDVPPPAGCPTLTAPANNATLAPGSSVTLTWEPVTGATAYDVYVGVGTATPSAVAIDVTATTYTYTLQASQGTSYKWYVVPKNAGGSASGCNAGAKEFRSSVTPTMASIAGTYKLTAVTIDGMNAMSLMDPCDRDNLIVLNVNGTYAVNDVGTVCSPPSNDAGTWSVPTATTFNLDGDIWTITAYDGIKLEMAMNYQGMALTQTLTRQ